jgi:carbamate kinase
MTQTIVVALGGNALSPSEEPPLVANQFRHTRESLAPIVELARQGWRIAIVHGNGPQVGAALERNEMAVERGIEALPLGVLVAATAGWIGYMIQQSLQNALRAAGVQRRAFTVITQTICRTDDPSLAKPTKPIGFPLAEERVARLRNRGIPVGEGAEGWRRLAPSPRPQGVVEGALIGDLVRAGHIVIACGGGGPPVHDAGGGQWEGMEAVVDKDLSAAILARELGADVLLILTKVDALYDAFGTPDARAIPALSVSEAAALLAREDFATGSMGPKVEAAVQFAQGGGRAVIAQLERGVDALRGHSGTTIGGG